MDDEIRDQVRREVAMAFAQQHTKGTLVCTAYDPDKHTVKGMIMPQKVESGWMPLGAIHVGNGFGIVVGPKVGSADKLDGDQFDIHFENGDPNTPMAAHRVHSSKAKAPRVETGEMLFRHELGMQVNMSKDGSGAFTHGKGSSFAFDKDGHQSVKTNNLNLTVDAGTGGVTYKAKSHAFEGDLDVAGNVNATGKVDGAGGVSQNGMALT